MYTMVSEIHDNVDLVLGVKNFVKLGEISMRELNFKFLNRVVPIFPVKKEVIKPKGRRPVKVPFLNQISGLGIIKLLWVNTCYTLARKIKFERNKTFLGVRNYSSQVIVLDPKRAKAIVDIHWVIIQSNKTSYNKDWINIILLSHGKKYFGVQ